MRPIALAFTLGLALSFSALAGCDDSDGNGNGAPLTMCDLNFAAENAALKGFGRGCEQDSECAFSECLMPGTGGNITNSIFGFCTRGCDCENNTASQLPADKKEELDCLYPAGFRNMHHVVVECNSVAECQALDPRWNDCRLADSGNARKVCHAR
jgi:hypothetical protein